MKFSADGASVEVVLSCNDAAYAEYNANDESERERSCFIGVATGQALQIHLRHSGNWPGTKTDIIVDGEIRRFVRQNNVSHEETMIKYVDQVWVESEKGHGYGKMVFKDTELSSELPLKSAVNPITELFTSDIRGSLVVEEWERKRAERKRKEKQEEEARTSHGGLTT